MDTAKLTVTFSLTGDKYFDPFEFSAKTGITATKQWRLGENHRGGQRRHSFWSYSQETAEDGSAEACFASVLETARLALARLDSHDGIEPQLAVRITVPRREATGLFVDAEQVRTLAAMGAALDVLVEVHD